MNESEDSIQERIIDALIRKNYVVEVTTVRWHSGMRKGYGATEGIGDLLVWAEWWKSFLPGFKVNLEVKTPVGKPTLAQKSSILRGGLPIVRNEEDALKEMVFADRIVIHVAQFYGVEIDEEELGRLRRRSRGSRGVWTKGEWSDVESDRNHGMRIHQRGPGSIPR
jgi:hypothetical protein